MNPNDHKPDPSCILNWLWQTSLPVLLLVTLFSCSDTSPETDKSTFISNPFMSKPTSSLPDSVAKSGKEVFTRVCKICHKDAVNLQAPGLDILNTLTPGAILAAMNNGKMKLQSERLTPEEKKQWRNGSLIKCSLIRLYRILPICLSAWLRIPIF